MAIFERDKNGLVIKIEILPWDRDDVRVMCPTLSDAQASLLLEKAANQFDKEVESWGALAAICKKLFPDHRCERED